MVSGRVRVGWMGVVVALGALGCAESGTLERATIELNRTRQEAWQKEQRLRALEWQLAAVGQQAQAALQRGEAVQRELAARAEALAAANAALTERLKKAEEERRLAELSEGGANGRNKAKACSPLRPEERRKLDTAVDSLGRIEKLLREQADRDARNKKRPKGGEVVDPWGFGERK